MIIFYSVAISYAFFVLKAQDLGLGTVEVVLYYVMLNIVFLLMAITSGSLSDRIGRRRVIMFSMTLFMISCLVMTIADSTLLLAIGLIIDGLYLGSSEGVMKAFVIDAAPCDLRGTVIGAFNTCVGISMLPGGAAVGLLWDRLGPRAAFTFGAVTTLVSLALKSAFKNTWKKMVCIRDDSGR